MIKLDIGKENTALSYFHTFSLQSPAFPAPRSDACLSLEYTAETQFTVRLACLSGDKVDEDVLRRSTLGFGYELHRMNRRISPKGDQYEKCLLVFDVTTDKSGFLAAISDVHLTEGTCAYPGPSHLLILVHFY